MGLLDPAPPPYDPLEWSQLPFAEKSRQVCQAWALQGYGTPAIAYLFYGLKALLYFAAWVWFCSRSPGLGGLSNLSSWVLEPLAFQKAIVWSLLFEILGLGCGSGPLTGRYMPPVGGFLYFLCPGTLKLSLLPGWPIVGGHRRSLVDVALYAGFVLVLLKILLSPELSGGDLWLAAVLLPLMAVSDKTVFLAARAEHYWVTLVLFVVATQWIAPAKAVAAALWFWAGVSKLNHHFPFVTCVLMSNHPFIRSIPFRKKLYRSYPNDLRPSTLAVLMAHIGTSLELLVPILLLSSSGGPLLWLGMGLMLALHFFITSSVPMGVPLEWNILVVYSAFFLFFEHAHVGLGDISPAAWLVVAIASLAVPLVGNLFPHRVSFLPSMRYYAGNWANSVWLFRDQAHRKLESLKTPSRWIYDQLAPFYSRATAINLVGKVIAFRLMHLHGRAYTRLVPQAVQPFSRYEWLDGELVAGMTIGWNFGDGHLHNEQLLEAIQNECGFLPGELRCVFIESQPMAQSTLSWRIVDCAEGLLDQGSLDVEELRHSQPWPNKDNLSK